MSRECFDCDGDVDHCHGTLVVHPAGGAECTEDGCADRDRHRHTLVTDCGLDGCRCGQPSAAAELARAS